MLIIFSLGNEPLAIRPLAPMMFGGDGGKNVEAI